MMVETIPQVTEAIPQIAETIVSIADTIPEITEIIPQVTEVIQVSGLVQQTPMLEAYATTYVPIIVSIIAIIISITTAKKQNGIALFDLRYRCLSQIQTVLSFESSISDCDEAIILLSLFDAFWGTSVANKGYDEKLIRTKGQLEVIKHDLLQVKFLFRYKCEVDITKLAVALHEVMLDAVNGDVSNEKMERFHKLAEEFYEKDFEMLAKKTKV